MFHFLAKMSTILKHLKQKKRLYPFGQKMTRSNKRKMRENFEIWKHVNPSGIFAFLPLEVCHLVFKCTPLKALGVLSLSSRSLRDMVVNYLYSSQASEMIVPVFEKDRENQWQMASLQFHSHYKNLGKILLFDDLIWCTIVFQVLSFQEKIKILKAKPFDVLLKYFFRKW